MRNQPILEKLQQIVAAAKGELEQTPIQALDSATNIAYKVIIALAALWGILLSGLLFLKPSLTWFLVAMGALPPLALAYRNYRKFPTDYVFLICMLVQSTVVWAGIFLYVNLRLWIDGLSDSQLSLTGDAVAFSAFWDRVLLHTGVVILLGAIQFVLLIDWTLRANAKYRDAIAKSISVHSDALSGICNAIQDTLRVLSEFAESQRSLCQEKGTPESVPADSQQ